MYTPEKRNMSPENQWLEDVLPIQIVPYKGIYDIFQGCRCFWITRNLFFTQGLPTLLPALQVAAVWARKSGKHMRRWWGLVGWFLLFKFVVERYWNLGALLSSCVDSLLEKNKIIQICNLMMNWFKKWKTRVDSTYPSWFFAVEFGFSTWGSCFNLERAQPPTSYQALTY